MDNFDINTELKNSSELSDFMVDVLNEYLIYYKNIFQKTSQSTLFDGIDANNSTSTNFQLEDFYGAKYKFESYEKTNPKLTQIYSVDEYKNSDININDYELFGIKYNDDLLYVSPSLFAILIEIVNLKYENKSNTDSYVIIPIKNNS